MQKFGFLWNEIKLIQILSKYFSVRFLGLFGSVKAKGSKYFLVRFLGQFVSVKAKGSKSQANLDEKYFPFDFSGYLFLLIQGKQILSKS